MSFSKYHRRCSWLLTCTAAIHVQRMHVLQQHAVCSRGPLVATAFTV